jgi:signal transduction histidine kinase
MVVLATARDRDLAGWPGALGAAYGVWMATVAPGGRTARATFAPLRWLKTLIRNFVFVISGIPVQLAGPAVLGLPWLIPHFVPVAFWPVLGVLALSAVLELCARAPLTYIQRRRCRAVLGVDIPAAPPSPGPSAWRRLWNSLRSEATWRQLGYHCVIGPVLAAGGLAVLAMLVGGIELASMASTSTARSVSPKTQTIETALGVLLVVTAPVVAAFVSWLDQLAMTALLGPSRSAELEHRVQTLSQSRAGVVDAADAERRRIERDLHDGAQQRLVSLAMNLGIARETLTGLPDEAMQVIVAAHDEAKEALAELRGLVRGLHPAVLDDRGLDAALSGIAARAPLPVRLTVDVARRASPTVEAVAYFVVSECLANIARHSSARQAAIEVRRLGDLLHIQVTDDGVGGADPAHGTGLASLAQRAKSVDGTLHVASPPGGPTVVTAELPCES